MKELISFGPVHIYFLGLMIAIGITSASIFAVKQAEKRGVSEDSMLNLIIIVVIAEVIGARLFYILFYNPAFYITMDDERLRDLINEINDCRFISDKIAMIKEFIHR